MNNDTIIQTLSQAKSSDLAEEIQTAIRGEVRNLILSVIDSEVNELCGEKHLVNNKSKMRRAGSAKGSVIIETRKESIVRPRVRKVLADGSETEYSLKTYAATRDPQQLKNRILTALIAGVSCRDQSKINPCAPVSKSQVSRLWEREGKRFFQSLRERDLTSEKWVALLLDGITLSKDVTAIVALGVTLEGRKFILDFQLGSSENFEVCRDLLRNIKRRKFAAEAGYRLFSVIDGSAALRKAVLKIYPDTVIQRCVIHKERNVKNYLSRRDWAEASRLFSRLRKCEGEHAAREGYDELKSFLKSKNSAAYNSLLEAGDDLLSLQKLGVPATLNTTFLSTNIIENPYRNVRRKLGRVSRWRAETEQASRWLATALLVAEEGFQRITGYRDLGELHSRLKKPEPSTPAQKFHQGATPEPQSPSSLAHNASETNDDGDGVSGGLRDETSSG